jgi:putative hydrolase of HD superfamily
LGECFTGDIPVFDKTAPDRDREEDLLAGWAKGLPEEVSGDMAALFAEMREQRTPEARLCKALDKLEAVIQHNESPLSTWEEHEYELQRTYAHETVAFSPWLTALRKEILADTEKKIETEQP